MSKASEITRQVKERLEQIGTDRGYSMDVKAVFTGSDNGKEKQAPPYLVLRVLQDRRTSTAGTQATRLRTYQIEVVFNSSAEDSLLDDAGVDILRALGFGQDDWDERLPGLVDDEDTMEYTYRAAQGVATRSLFVAVGVTYAETYN